MPVAVIDPTVHAQGAIPASPISGIMQGLIAQQASMYPTPLERSEMQYRQAETQRLQQANAAGGNMGSLVSSLYSPENLGPPPQGPTVSGAPLSPPAPHTIDQRMTGSIGDIFKTAFDSGHPELAGSLIRTIAANAPGVTYNSGDLNHPSPVSAAMVGTGESPLNTPEAMSAGMTPGQRDRNAKISDMMAANPGISRNAASNIADGVTSVEIDPTTKNAFLVNKLDKTSELLRSPAQGTNPTASGAAPASPSTPGNNPFNLRPVGATTGFQSFSTPQEGLTAGIHDLATKLSGQSQAMAGKAVTLRNIISTYSPPSENNTPQLIANASQRMGVDPDAPLNVAHLLPLTQAILAQEQGGTAANTLVNGQPSTGTSAPASPAQGGAFNLQRGDLGIPFDAVYGGPATAARVMGGLSAMSGNAEANGGATTALSTLNNIKNQLISIKSLQPGMRTNASQQARFAQQLPPTDPQLLDKENLAEGATTGAGSAEDQINSALGQAVQDRLEDDKLLTSPNTSAEERQYAEMRRDKTDKLFAGLPPAVQANYQKVAGQAALPQTNLQLGQGATTVPQYGNADGKPVVTPNDIAFMAQKYNITPQAVVTKLRALGKVK